MGALVGRGPSTIADAAGAAAGIARRSIDQPGAPVLAPHVFRRPGPHCATHGRTTTGSRCRYSLSSEPFPADPALPALASFGRVAAIGMSCQSLPTEQRQY